MRYVFVVIDFSSNVILKVFASEHSAVRWTNDAKRSEVRRSLRVEKWKVE